MQTSAGIVSFLFTDIEGSSQLWERDSVRRLRRSGCVDRLVETELVRSMKARHFSQRTRDALREDAKLFVGRDAAARLTDQFERRYVDVKRLDAQALLAYLNQPNSAARRLEARAFPATGHWREQFEKALADVPPLR
jgi:hypothetical protein